MIHIPSIFQGQEFQDAQINTRISSAKDVAVATVDLDLMQVSIIDISMYFFKFGSLL